MIEIKLTRGYVAVVDDCDADLAELRWACLSDCRSRTSYALHSNRAKQPKIRMHRVIVERMIGRPLLKCEIVDHIDRNGLNNCRSNLRLAKQSENQANTNMPKHNTAGFKGVTSPRVKRNSKRFTASIHINRRTIQIGAFDTAVEAHFAYCYALLKHYGGFAHFGDNSPFLGYTLADFERGYRQPTQLALPLKDAA